MRCLCAVRRLPHAKTAAGGKPCGKQRRGRLVLWLRASRRLVLPLLLHAADDDEGDAGLSLLLSPVTVQTP